MLQVPPDRRRGARIPVVVPGLGRRLRRSPWPDAPPARAQIVTPTAIPPDRLARVRSRGRRNPCTRDRSPPGRAPPSAHAGRSVSPAPSPPHPAPAPRRGGVSARAERWRTVRCRGAGCRTVFSICGACYRGQAYCGARCRAPAQRQHRRDANARHQRSPEGRLDHRDRQRAYRARRRRRGVTDTPSTRPPRSATIAPAVRHAAIRPVCLVCGRVWRDDEGPPRETGRGGTMKGTRRWRFVT